MINSYNLEKIVQRDKAAFLCSKFSQVPVFPQRRLLVDGSASVFRQMILSVWVAFVQVRETELRLRQKLQRIGCLQLRSLRKTCQINLSQRIKQPVRLTVTLIFVMISRVATSISKIIAK